jgi:hypothetical protein
MNSRTYDYKVIKTSWGIAISLKARVVPAESVRDAVPITRLIGIAYALEGRDVVPAENEQFVLALRALAPRIETEIKDPIVIEVQQISYMPTDFQIEGLRAAMHYWATEEFGLASPDIPVSYDAAVKRYRFVWPN